jgi:hypothetical protein
VSATSVATHAELCASGAAASFSKASAVLATRLELPTDGPCDAVSQATIHGTHNRIGTRLEARMDRD